MARGRAWSGRKMIDAQPGGEEPAFCIRAFRYPEDYAPIIRLWETSGPGVHVGRSDTPDEIQKKLERDPDLFLVAEQDGRIIGSVLGGFDGRRGMVYHLAVTQDYRRQGLGAALMSELETRLRAKGCIRAYMLVTLDNQEAMQFYENKGWSRMALHAYAKDMV